MASCEVIQEQHKQFEHHHQSDQTRTDSDEMIKHMFINRSDQETHSEFAKGHAVPALPPSEGA
jgi:hypothetical protein